MAEIQQRNACGVLKALKNRRFREVLHYAARVRPSGRRGGSFPAAAATAPGCELHIRQLTFFFPGFQHERTTK